MGEDQKPVDTSNLSQIDLNKIKGVVDQEFDLEILLKHKDLSLVENEIGKAEAQLTVLKKFYEDKAKEEAETNRRGRRKNLSANSSKNLEEPSEYSKKYTQLLSILNNGGSGTIAPKKRKQETVYSPVSNGYMQTRSQSSALRPVARMRPSINSVECKYQQQNKCICRRSDNVLVSLQCPKCAKKDFLSPQGFINHCRIAHMIDILSHDHAAMTCGTLLPKEEQDDDGLEALENLQRHGLDPTVNLNKPDLEDYAKTNKQDPLASMNINKITDTQIENQNKKRKPSEALSPTTMDCRLSPESNSPPITQSKATTKNSAKAFNPSFSHLKSLLGDQVPNFDGLVSSATEELQNDDSESGDDDDEDDNDDEEDGKGKSTNKNGSVYMGYNQRKLKR